MLFDFHTYICEMSPELASSFFLFRHRYRRKVCIGVIIFVNGILVMPGFIDDIAVTVFRATHLNRIGLPDDNIFTVKTNQFPRILAELIKKEQGMRECLALMMGIA